MLPSRARLVTRDWCDAFPGLEERAVCLTNKTVFTHLKN